MRIREIRLTIGATASSRTAESDGGRANGGTTWIRWTNDVDQEEGNPAGKRAERATDEVTHIESGPLPRPCGGPTRREPQQGAALMKCSTWDVGLDVHPSTTLATVRQSSGKAIARSVLPTEEAALLLPHAPATASAPPEPASGRSATPTRSRRAAGAP
jgi:hypothetical protein